MYTSERSLQNQCRLYYYYIFIYFFEVNINLVPFIMYEEVYSAVDKLRIYEDGEIIHW